MTDRPEVHDNAGEVEHDIGDEYVNRKLVHIEALVPDDAKEAVDFLEDAKAMATDRGYPFIGYIKDIHVAKMPEDEPQEGGEVNAT